MKLDPQLRQLASDLVPTSDQRARVRSIIERRIEGPAVLRDAKTQATPVKPVSTSLWQQLLGRIQAPTATSIFDRIRTLLDPASDAQQTIRSTILSRLMPSTPMPLAQRIYKWGAAFIIVVMALRASPLLFLAPQSNADSSILLRPSSAGVDLSLEGLWQPVTQETELHETVTMRTGEGEATIMFYDDGNVRIDRNTTVTLQDVSNQPARTSLEPTLSIASGRVWLQGLLPDQVRGFIVTTPSGMVTVRGGSVSIDVQGSTTRVEAWDRHVTVTEGSRSLSLVSGEYIVLPINASLTAQTLPSGAYKQPWVAQNLQRDAVHQRELAQLQQERRSADAGILPSSPLYTVKRVAETMDVLLTLDPEAKVQKRLQQATTRLNEAAAMIVQGDSGSSVPLDEYKRTMIEVASGSGDSMTQALVQQQVAENAAQLSAALPDDQLYILKKAVLEAGADLPDDVLDQRDVSGTLLVDTLDALHQAIIDGNIEQARAALEVLKPYLPALKNGSDGLRPEIRKEALALLQDVVQGLANQTPTTSGSTLSTDVANQIAQYLPAPTETAVRPVVVETPPMTEEQLASAVQATLRRVFTIYKMPQSRVNAMRVEIKKFEGKTDEGRYLRRLYHEIPEEDADLKQLVRHAIQMLREEQFVD